MAGKIAMYADAKQLSVAMSDTDIRYRQSFWTALVKKYPCVVGGSRGELKLIAPDMTVRCLFDGL